MLRPLENGGILCFVEMSTQGEADKAIASLNGKRVCGKMMWVKYARPKPPREGGRREGGGGRQGDRQERGQPFGQRGGFGDRSDGFKRFEAGRGNDRSKEGRSGERGDHGDRGGRFGQDRQVRGGDGGNNRGGPNRNFEKREEDRSTRMFDRNGQGNDNNRGREREQGSRSSTVGEEMDY
jgi:RNA recognition motif-containing protein